MGCIVSGQSSGHMLTLGSIQRKGSCGVMFMESLCFNHERIQPPAKRSWLKHVETKEEMASNGIRQKKGQKNQGSTRHFLGSTGKGKTKFKASGTWSCPRAQHALGGSPEVTLRQQAVLPLNDHGWWSGFNANGPTAGHAVLLVGTNDLTCCTSDDKPAKDKNTGSLVWGRAFGFRELACNRQIWNQDCTPVEISHPAGL